MMGLAGNHKSKHPHHFLLVCHENFRRGVLASFAKGDYMRKETVSLLLNKLEKEAKRVSDQRERNARMNAIRQCEECLALPWTQMLDALARKWKKNTDEGLPLLKKPQDQRSEEENAHLKRALAVDNI